MRPAVVIGTLLLALPAVGCGKEIDVPEQDGQMREAAVLFSDRCSGCHSLDVAAAVGSKATGTVGGGERTNGPNFNSRRVSRDDALFAIRNGGFSGAIMPANIVVGDDAEKIAEFLDRYSGRGGEGADIGQEQRPVR